MSDDLSQSGESESRSVEGRIDEICDHFEAAWKQDSEPVIEEYLREMPELARGYLFRQLLMLELEYRQRLRERPEADEYRKRFPEFEQEITDAFSRPSNQTPQRQPVEPSAEDTDLHVSGADLGTGQQTEWARPGAGKETLPDRIGRYEVQRYLGAGAFGDVYLARDSELKRYVALKVPREARFSSLIELEQCVQEARTAAQLEHPGIVPVYDVLRESDRVVIVQQYVEGQDLFQLVNSGTTTPQRAVELMVAIAEAIGFAHQKGFIHRDLKPSNILLGKDGRPRVADFGLAIHESAQRRRRGEMSGTPAYMSPEQVRGETHRLDGRSDLWSLGVILYEMLTSRRPFAGANRDELFDEIECRDAKPLRMTNPEIPLELERICLKCLSKRVTDRYSSAGDLAEDLRHWLSNYRSQAASHASSSGACASSYAALSSAPRPRVRASLVNRTRPLEDADLATWKVPLLVGGLLWAASTISLVLAYYTWTTEAWSLRFNQLGNTGRSPGLGFITEAGRSLVFLSLVTFMAWYKFHQESKALFSRRRQQFCKRVNIARGLFLVIALGFGALEATRHLTVARAPEALAAWATENSIVTTPTAEWYPYAAYLPYSLINYMIVVPTLIVVPMLALSLDVPSLLRANRNLRSTIKDENTSEEEVRANFAVFENECQLMCTRYLDVLALVSMAVHFEYWLGKLTLTEEAFGTMQLARILIAMAFVCILSITYLFGTGLEMTKTVLAARGSTHLTGWLREHNALTFVITVFLYGISGLIVLSLAVPLLDSLFGWGIGA